VNSAFFFQERKPIFTGKISKELLSEKWKNLTNREFDVLELIAKGNTTKKISETLQISVLTVNKHRQNIIAKTSTGNINELLNEIFYGSL
jgi:DNA-binding CsgD family transcriptional regulator